MHTATNCEWCYEVHNIIGISTGKRVIGVVTFSTKCAISLHVNKNGWYLVTQVVLILSSYIVCQIDTVAVWLVAYVGIITS